MNRQINNNEIDYDRYPPVIEICMENAVCNMKCKYCFGGYIDNHNCHTGEVPKFDANILDFRLSKVDPAYRGIVKIWGGEPLANYDTFKQVAKYIRAKFPYAQLILVTNGSLLNEAKAEFLIDNNVKVNMSHDGSGQSLRGADPLENENVLSAINYLKLNGCFSSFHMVIHNKSDDLFEQITYWNEKQKLLKFPIIVSWSIFRVTDDWTDEFIPNMENHNKFIDYTFECMQDAARGYNRKVMFTFSTDQDRALRSILFNESSKYPCSTFDALTVGLTGKIYRCVQDCERRSVVDSDTYAELMIKDNYKLLPECDSCPALKECSGMCAVLTDEQRRKNCSNYINFIQYMKDYLHKDFNRARIIARFYGRDLQLIKETPPVEVTEEQLDEAEEIKIDENDIVIH